MTEWNIMATSYMRQERYLIRMLNRYGEFKRTSFRDVLLGHVDDTDEFLAALEREEPERLRSLSQIVPLEKEFHFELPDLNEKLKEAVTPYIDSLTDKTFHVRVSRRGHKGEISSLEIEKELDAFIMECLAKSGKVAKVDFEVPDFIVIVETIGNWAGVGLIPREMKARCHFIRVK